MYSNLQLDLAQLDYKKHTWISQISLLFTFHDGYLIHDNGEEIEISLNGVYGTKVLFLLRNHQFEDINALYEAVVHTNYNFLSEIIDSIPGLRILKIINMGAGIGITAICLSSFFKTATIRAFEANKPDFEQLKKNLILNKIEDSVIDAYSQHDGMAQEIADCDLLVYSSKAVNHFISSGEGADLIPSAKIIMAESFLSTEDKDKFIEYTSALQFAHKFFGQTAVCWKRERKEK